MIAAIRNEGTFEDGYESTSFRNARRNLEAEWDRYYGNSYYGYEDGIAVTATSKDGTYATVTSQPTLKVTRDVDNAITNYEVSFKVRFTNTTFRTADVDIDVTYRAGGSVQEAFYSHEDTLSFTVFQAQYRTFTEQDALIAFGVTPNAVLLPTIPPTKSRSRREGAGSYISAPARVGDDISCTLDSG